MKKKILSLVLALSMVLSFFPGMTMTASAAEGDEAVWVFLHFHCLIPYFIFFPK